MKHWIQAARLRTLPLSLSGIIVGSFLAASKQLFRWDICVFALLTTIGFQVLSNFANDYGDGVKGTDNNGRVGPQRALQSGVITPKQMLKGIYMVVAITVLLAITLIYISFGKESFVFSIVFLGLGLGSIVAAIKYTMGKNAYGYSGFGDVFVFLFFGLLGVLGCEFLYVQQVDALSLLPAATIGFFSVSVLNLNNMRDRISDLQSNKNTLAVKLGASKVKIYHYLLILGGMSSAFVYLGLHAVSSFQFMCVIAFVPLVKNMVVVYQNQEAVLLDPELKKVALSTFLFSLLFGLGLII